MRAHRFKLNRPASKRALAKFESKHGIELPRDFRAFISELGNGGAGPYYGILPLSKWTDHIPLADIPTGFLAEPNPIPHSYERSDNWLETYGLTEDDWCRGTIVIASQGCTYYCTLIVSGPCRGRILYVDECLEPPHLLAERCFLDWYERWLDETIAGYEIFWFGMEAGGRDNELIEKLRGAELPSDRATAANELGRRRTPSDEIVQALSNATLDDATEVQCAALRALRHSHAAGLATAPAFLSNSSEDLRDAAAWLLQKIAAPTTIDQLRQALRSEPDEEVFFGIGCALKDSNGLVACDLVPVLRNSNAKMRAHAAYFLGETNDLEAAAALVKHLDDPDRTVRVYVVQSLKTLGAVEAVPAMKARAAIEPSNLVQTNLRVAIEELGHR